MKNIQINTLILSLFISSSTFAQSTPELRRCLVSVIWRNGVKPYNMKLISAGVAWYDKTSKFKSDHQIEITGVSGRIYTAYCDMGSTYIDQKEPATNLISAAVPCDEDGVGYRIKNISTGEIVGEERFESTQEPSVTLEISDPKRGRVRVGGIPDSFSAQFVGTASSASRLTPQQGVPTSFSIHYSFDGGQSWINNTGNFNARRQVPFEVPPTKGKEDQPVIVEVQVAVGLRMYRHRFQLGEKAIPLSMKGVPEIRHEN